MNSETWRLAQIFLGDEGISEVYIEMDTHRIRCNCSVYTSKGRCPHTVFVRSKMQTNGGVYPVHAQGGTEQEAKEAKASYSAFREFILKHGKIEVL